MKFLISYRETMIVNIVVFVLMLTTCYGEILSVALENYKLLDKTLDEYPQSVKDDALLDVPQLIAKYGYPVETHNVTTSDGYILSLHRIPHGKNGTSPTTRVVFLQHGILQSSASFVISGVDKALAYFLADSGYDVWMGNARGTQYSRSHVKLDPDEGGEFWDFSWHEIGVTDLPAMIDFVLAHTKQEKLFYVGHSQGNTVFYVMCSERPDYNSKIVAHFSLSPTAYMGRMTSPLVKLMSRIPGRNLLLKLIGRYEFLPSDGFLSKLSNAVCGVNTITRVLCRNSLFAICGFNYKQMNVTLLPVIMGHTPAGASTKQFLHYLQEIKSGKFRRYDYGFIGNLKEYGTRTPPKYNLNSVSAPVYLHYSRNDWLSNERDVIKLYSELGNVQSKLLIPDERFNHVDYMFGIDAKDMIYRKILSIMNRYKD